MRLLPSLTLFLVGFAIAGCGSGVHDRLRNEAEVMYRVPAYPAAAQRQRADEDDEMVYVRPSYVMVPPDCGELVYGADGYHYCIPE